MKYLVLAAILAVIYMMWKRQRAQDRADRQAGAGGSSRGRPDDGTKPQAMVRCAVCDLHLPRGDAVPDAQGRMFCSVAHRDQANT